MIPPDHVRFDMTVLGKTQILLGSNTDTFWFYLRQDEGTMRWGHHDSVKGSMPAGMPIRPDMIIEALGLSRLDTETTGLDPGARADLWHYLRQVREAEGVTVVLTTHLLEEAERADRIAIMKDGAIIQIGTPEDLVVNPATDYVAEFTHEVPRAKVLTAGSVMTALDGAPIEAELAGRIAAGERIEVLAAEVVAAEQPFLVVDESGAALGLLTREAVIQVLVGGGRGT